MTPEELKSEPAPAQPTPYAALVSVLNRCSSNLAVPLSIEILPPSHPLQPGVFVTVKEDTIFTPKSTLLKAFITAREIFFSHNPASTTAPCPPAIIDSSAVILLFDPEHITAANARKRDILAYGRREAAVERAAVELWYTEGMLTSRMKRHNKSPTLWGHRRWVLKMMEGLGGIREVRVVALRSAENHPKNYYAWDFVRWWIGSCPEGLQAFDLEGEKTTGTDRRAVPAIVAFYMEWALRHPDDTSGWSFLLWLLDFATAGAGAEVLRAAVLAEVLSRAGRFGLKNESLRMFLRTLKGTERMSVADLQQDYDNQNSLLSKFES